jgi:Streptomyces sporulation and cell division protein, SsgA
MDRSTVSHHVALRLLSGDGQMLPLAVELHYDVADPLAVTALFDEGGDHRIRWVFARDLLEAGLDQRSGDGDVVVWPTEDADGHAVVHLRLCSPDGDALLEASADDVERFLIATWLLVPPGTEHQHLDVDTAIRALLPRG